MDSVYCCYPEGRYKALTLSYDDNTPDANSRLIGIFNQYGIKATFNLNGGLFAPDVDRNAIRSMYEGHEIASHTATHPTIARCPLPEVIQEILNDRKALEGICGYPVRGFAYPNSSMMRDDIVNAIPACGIRYARSGGSTHSFTLPNDYYRWENTCRHNDHLMEYCDAFLSLQKNAYLFLMYVMGHSFEFDRDGNWDLIEKFCKKAGGREDIWYCTNISFVDYMDAFARLQFAADNSFVFNPSAADVWVRINRTRVIKIPGGTSVQLA